MILSGWKEIAHYTGRGVRTVQRWEQFGLPVRRPARHLRSAVAAESEDIDKWLRTTGPQPRDASDNTLEQTATSKTGLRSALAEHRTLLDEQAALREKLADVRRKFEALQASFDLRRSSPNYLPETETPRLKSA